MRRLLLLAFILSSSLMAAEPWGSVTKPESPSVSRGKPTIIVSLSSNADANSFRVTLDDVDMSTFLHKSAEGWALTPPTPLTAGKHTLTLKARDIDGVPLPPVTWTFTVTLAHKRAVGIAGSVDDTYRHENRHHNIGHEGDTRSGNATVSLSVETNHFNHTLDLAGVYISPQPVTPSGRKIDLSSATYNVTYHDGGFKAGAAFGRVSYNLSPLVISGYGTRGGILNLQGSHVGLELFSLDARRPYGWRGNVGPGSDTDNHINGFRLFGRPVKGWEIYSVYLKGAEPSPGSPTTGSEETSRSAEVMGIGTKINKKGWNALAEVFGSEKMSSDDESHTSYRFLVGKQGKAVGAQVSFQHIGKGYQTPGVPYLADNRDQAQGNVQFRHKKTSLGFTVGYQHEKERWGVPNGLEQWQGGITLMQQVTSHLSLNTSLNVTDMKPDDVKDPFSQRATTTSGSVGISYSRGIHSLQLSTNYTTLNDKSERDSDNQAYGYSILYSLRPATWLDVTSSIQLNLSRPTFQMRYTRQTTYNLDLRSHFFNNTLNVDLGGSLSRTEQVNLLHGSTYASMRLRVDYAPPTGIAWGRGSLSLTASEVHTDMQIANLSTLQIFLSANFSLTGRHTYGQ